jgi:hypothetical protein
MTQEVVQVNPFTINPPVDSTNYFRRCSLTVAYLKGEGISGPMLDIGSRTQFTSILEDSFKTDIDNTKGDLDIDFTVPGKRYRTILYLHVIEHQFNPLFTLLELRDYLTDDGYIYIEYPQRGCYNTPHHYHEIPDYQFKVLAARAGYHIVNESRWLWVPGNTSKQIVIYKIGR